MKMEKNEPWGEFCNIFGVNPRNRVLEFLLETRELDFGVGDIARETGLNRATTYNVMGELIENKYLTCSRKISGTQLYRLNLEKREVRFLIKIFNMILKNLAGRYNEKIREKIYA